MTWRFVLILGSALAILVSAIIALVKEKWRSGALGFIGGVIGILISLIPTDMLDAHVVSGRTLSSWDILTPAPTSALIPTPPLVKSISDYAGGFKAVASSTYKQKYTKEYKVTAAMAVDGKLETAWNEGANGAGLGEWIEVSPNDYGEYEYRGFKIANGFQYPDYSLGDRYKANFRVKELSVSIDGKQIGTFLIQDLANGYDKIVFDNPVIGTTLRFTIVSIYTDREGKYFDETCISEIAPF